MNVNDALKLAHHITRIIQVMISYPTCNNANISHHSYTFDIFLTKSIEDTNSHICFKSQKQFPYCIVHSCPDCKTMMITCLMSVTLFDVHMVYSILISCVI